MSTYRVLCECGYHVGGLSLATAEEWSGQHADDTCDPVIEVEGAKP